MLADVLRYLCCALCGSELAAVGGALRCAAGHSFDVARQGYVNMLGGARAPGTADTPEMVRARAEFLAAGHYAPLAERVAATARSAVQDVGTGIGPGTGTDVDAGIRGGIAGDIKEDLGREVEREAGREVGKDVEGCVLDLGAGTGYHLSRVLDELPRHVGVALDISKHAARRAARAHPRVGAVVADTWRRLPVRTETAVLAINIFAPRNAGEIHRVLRPEGSLVVVTPSPRHLAEIVVPLGLLQVDEEKERRMDDQFARGFVLETRQEYEYGFTPTPDDVLRLVGMGPSAWHADTAAVRSRIERAAPPSTVTASFVLSVYRRKDRGGR